jgi:transposase
LSPHHPPTRKGSTTKKLSIPKNVELEFLPPYSPELNPVERLWQDLKDALGFDLYEHLADLQQKARTVLSLLHR